MIELNTHKSKKGFALSSFDHLESAPAQDVLRWAIGKFGSRIAITTSFQREGMVIVDMAAKISPDVRVLTLDTGRLPPETYDMIEAVRAKYRLPVEVVSPDAAEIESMVTKHGPNLFYESVALRTLCCHFRKVRPLERKMDGLDAWVAGLRRSQSETRGSLAKIQEIDGRLKISPLADWTREQVRAYTAENSVPEHPLYAKGYESIGCDPCTRAIDAQEDERAGRWWWEQSSNKECGLHFTPDGRVERSVDVLIRDILVQHA
jgi:phosphoadenosine phosphosulfate reductase